MGHFKFFGQFVGLLLNVICLMSKKIVVNESEKSIKSEEGFSISSGFNVFCWENYKISSISEFFHTLQIELTKISIWTLE